MTRYRQSWWSAGRAEGVQEAVKSALMSDREGTMESVEDSIDRIARMLSLMIPLLPQAAQDQIMREFHFDRVKEGE